MRPSREGAIARMPKVRIRTLSQRRQLTRCRSSAARIGAECGRIACAEQAQLMNERDFVPDLTTIAWRNPNISDTTIEIDDRYAMGAGFPRR